MSKTIERPKMKIESFAIFVDLPLVVTGQWLPGGEPQRWIAKFQDCDIVRGHIAQSVTGFGETPEEALDALARAVIGQKIRYRPHGQESRYVDVLCDFLAYAGDNGLISWAEEQPF
jgi:hypothetical protein